MGASLALAAASWAAPLNLNLPSMGAVAGADLSPSQEQAMGDEIMREIRADPSYMDDPETLQYLNRLGYELASVVPSHTYSFFFFPIKDASLNAFAMPGGYIAVHSGLIASTRNENELAGVIAHEIGHVTQRHIARMIDAQRVNPAITVGSILLALLAARAGSADAAVGAVLGGQAMIASKQLSFSRQHEREADRTGLAALSAAGFDPRGMESFFARLQASNRYYEAASPQYLSTHPLTIERMSDMASRTKSLPARSHASSLDYHVIRARMRVLQDTRANSLVKLSRTLEQEYAANPAPREKAALAYALALANGELRKTAEARRWSRQARLDSPDKNNLFIEKLAAQVAFATGSREEKLAASARARELAVANPTSEVAVRFYADTLFELKRYKEAVRYLRRQQAFSPESASYASMMAQCYKAMGQMSEHYQYVGDMYLAQGDKKAAEYQYRLARKANDGDYYTMSRVDAKLRTVREDILLEEKSR